MPPIRGLFAAGEQALIGIETAVAIGVVVLAAGMTFLFSLPRSKPSKRYLRAIPAMQQFKRVVGLAVEEGDRLHVSIGSSSLLSPTSASALVALTVLERIAMLSSISDRPLVVTSGDGSLAILSQDTLRAAYRLANAQELYDPDRGMLAGPGGMSYYAGVLPVMRSQQIAANILIGHFGPEVGLLTEASEHDRMFTLAASDSLPAQAVMFGTAQNPLIGEELFVVPAYLGAGAVHHASVRVQDYLRWGLIAVLVVGAILKLVGIL
jgi:hypothetical protein